MTQLKVFVKTYGCQMNQLDSEFVIGSLLARGLAQAQNESQADVILLNTCCVREMAERKALGKMSLLAQMKKKKPNLVLGIFGCVAQNRKHHLFHLIPPLDIVCGTHQISRIPEMIDAVLTHRSKQIRVTEDSHTPLDFSSARRKSPIKAFVSIMRGCNNLCSYCVVPFVRGTEHSRPPQQILSEINSLAHRGYKEVTLLGQNVNSYGKTLSPPCHLVDLLERINLIHGIERIRFVTSHPKDISPALIHAIAHLEKVCEHLHFPLQSGSDKILNLMNRGYILPHYISLVHALRNAVPDIALATDIIVGFPGETEQDFAQTVEAMRTIQYDCAFIFKYSLREGTAAAQFPDDVPLQKKKERNNFLLQLQREISLRKNTALIGNKVEVFVEGPSKRDPKKMMGRTRQNKIAVFDAPTDLTGKILNLTVTNATPLTLFCQLPHQAQPRPPSTVPHKTPQPKLAFNPNTNP